jgi:hypothetical protein
MPTDDDVKKPVMALAPFMAEAAKQKHSMVQIELDPAGVPGPAVPRERAGRIFVAAAAGPINFGAQDTVAAAQSTEH